MLQRDLGEPAREWVSYGATVQDVADTWTGIVMRRMLEIAERDLAAIDASLVALAGRHRDAVMLGRTHGQPGLPITFGFKASLWVAELRRHRERIAQARPRLAVGQLAGAVGTLSAWGEPGLELQRRVLERLGLGVPDTSWTNARDRVAELVGLLGLITGTLAKIGNEVYNLQRPEIGELGEAPADGVVGSITMPQKRNPERSEHLSTLARVVRAAAAPALEGMVAEHERDGAAWKTEWALLPQACGAAAVALALAADLAAGLRVDEQRMRANVDAQRGYVLAEPAMLALGAEVGPRRAHELSTARPRAASAADPARGAGGRSRDRRAALAGAPRGAAPPRARARRGRRAGQAGARRCLSGRTSPRARTRAAAATLGAGRRAISRGPAPELVEAGYELELADAPLLARGLGLADLAHVIALDAIPGDDRRALLDALVALLDEEVAVDARYGDLANVRERALEQRIGSAAGWLNAGRPRREAGRIAFRIALRSRVLDLAAAVARYAAALAELGAAGARHADARLHVPAGRRSRPPPATGLLSFAYPALRDLERLRGDFELVNRSPAGTGGVNGSRFALDRERLAELLGFSRPIEHTRDANWQTDGLADLTSHAAIAATGASRFAEDVEIYGSEEFGLLRIGDELCRASALMPQKRNPYALVVLRGGAGTLIGRATGVLATQRTPSGRTDNLLYAYGEVAGAVDLAARLLRLAAAVAESLTVDADASRARAARERRDGDGRSRGDQPRDGSRLPLGVPRGRPSTGCGRRFGGRLPIARPRPGDRHRRARSRDGDRVAHRARRCSPGAHGLDARRLPRRGRADARVGPTRARRDRTRRAAARGACGRRLGGTSERQLPAGWGEQRGWPEYSSRRSSIATSMAGNIATCWIASRAPSSSTSPIHSSAIAPRLGTNIAAVISPHGSQPCPR